jgi:hypothetical protein
MSPERRGDKYRISFEEVTSNAKEIIRKDGHHVPVLIVEGSKNFIVSQIQACGCDGGLSVMVTF